MNEREDCGPAFPVTPNKYDPVWAAARDGGLSIRDYFAAKAMQGLMANSRVRVSYDEFAEASYLMADAMLEAREG